MTPQIGFAMLVALIVYLAVPYVLGKIRRRRNLKKLHEAVNNSVNNTPLLGVVYPVETTSKTKGKASK